jgi:hypothetical protein
MEQRDLSDEETSTFFEIKNKLFSIYRIKKKY